MRVCRTCIAEKGRLAGGGKLISRVFVENGSIMALSATRGFREVGIYEKHRRLDGGWKDGEILERLIPENPD